MISNTAPVATLHGGYITLDTIIAPTKVKNRRTKIVCTMGPACWSEEGLATLMDAGMNVARFNFSHGNHEAHGQVLDRLRKVAAEKSRNIAVLLDTKGPEIRSGFFSDGATKIDLVKGQTLILTTDYSFKGNAHTLACSYEKLASSVKPGQQILVADGSLVLTVLSCDTAAGQVMCKVENNASIGERKNMNLPGVQVDLPTFTEKDKHDIVEFGIQRRVEFIAASFVRKARDVQNLRQLLADHGGPELKIIAKIENLEGVENFDEILQWTDAVMVARGDLGMEIPPSKVFLAQKYMIRKANIAGKPVVTATQMLESMVQNPRPTRAECSDVANAVYDGTNAVMLSGETANGPYYEQAVKVMARTCCEAECSRNYNLYFQSVRNSIVHTYGSLTMGESLASSAVKTSVDVDAKLILVMSETGKTANDVTKFRPGRAVMCLTPDQTVARQLSGLCVGVHTIVVDSLQKSKELIQEISYELIESGMMKKGDAVVVVAGKMAGMKEKMEVISLGPGQKFGHIVDNSAGFFFNREMILAYNDWGVPLKKRSSLASMASSGLE